MSTSLNLSTRNSVQQATFVKFDTSEDGTPITVRMSTHDVPATIDGELYPAVGAMLSVSQITNEIKASQSDVTVTLSGIPLQYMDAILRNPIKGSPIEIRRAFFDAQTGQFLSIAGNPILEFSGVISNYAVDEGWTDYESQTVTTTISLSCSSIMSVLMNRVAGRRTNPADQDYWFEGDLSMNRVSVISDAVFDFGGTTPSAGVSTPSGKTVTGTAG